MVENNMAGLASVNDLIIFYVEFAACLPQLTRNNSDTVIHENKPRLVLGLERLFDL